MLMTTDIILLEFNQNVTLFYRNITQPPSADTVNIIIITLSFETRLVCSQCICVITKWWRDNSFYSMFCKDAEIKLSCSFYFYFFFFPAETRRNLWKLPGSCPRTKLYPTLSFERPGSLIWGTHKREVGTAKKKKKGLKTLIMLPTDGSVVAAVTVDTRWW